MGTSPKRKVKKKTVVKTKTIVFDGVVPLFDWNKKPDKYDDINGFNDLFDELKKRLQIGIGFRFKF